MLTSLNKIKIQKTLLLDYVHGTPWAILPSTMDVIHQVLFNHYNHQVVDLATIEAAIGKELDNTFDVQNKDGNAIIPIRGIIAKRLNMVQHISGGASTEVIQSAIEGALEDDGIKAIVLDINSSGGAVEGVKELADFIFESRGKKPITAFIDGKGASAAYWIASAADKVVAYDTAMVGSIGVVMTHYDHSKRDEQEGVKRTFIYAGHYKRLANDAEPLTKEGSEYLQSMVDDYYSIFVDSVARNRGVSVESVLKMGDGKLFIGKKALQVGLIDRLGRFPSVLVKGTSSLSAVPIAIVADKQVNIDINTQKPKEVIMNLQELKETHPELVKALTTEVQAALIEDNQKIKAEFEAVDKSNKELTKQLMILEENGAAVLAAQIKKDILAGSDIPENLHAKVSGMVDYRAYIDGGKFGEGSPAAMKFTEAFTAEVKDWEAKLPKAGTALGAGEPKKDVVVEGGATYSGDNSKVIAGL